jgi:predicted transcriptional regulator
MYHDIDYKDKQVVINILKDTEQKHQHILSNAKGKSIDELLIAEFGERQLKTIHENLQKQITQFAKEKP